MINAEQRASAIAAMKVEGKRLIKSWEHDALSDRQWTVIMTAAFDAAWRIICPIYISAKE